MTRQIRWQLTPQEQTALLRQPLLEGQPVSDDCDAHGLKPSLFYRWRKEFFENGAAAFEKTDKRTSPPSPRPPVVWAAVAAVGALLLGLIVWQGLFSFPSAPGSLVLELEPADAWVILLDINKPYQPGMELPAGDYWVVARRAGYEALKQPIRIYTDRDTKALIKLNLEVGAVFRDTLEDGGEGPQMVVLPTGYFQMGSPAGESGRWDAEGPSRTVTTGRRIAMGRYEVTFADYDRFVLATRGAAGNKFFLRPLTLPGHGVGSSISSLRALVRNLCRRAHASYSEIFNFFKNQ